MIHGIGTDIVEIKRMEEALKKAGFAEKYFTPQEREHAKGKAHPAETLSGYFAAKEAFAKALGMGFSGFLPGDVEVYREGSWPQLRLLGRAALLCGQAGVKQMHLSISHEAEYATAMVLLEK